MPVLSLTICTFAEGTTPPLESVTVPTMNPTSCWAFATRLKTQNKTIVRSLAHRRQLLLWHRASCWVWRSESIIIIIYLFLQVKRLTQRLKIILHFKSLASERIL